MKSILIDQESLYNIKMATKNIDSIMKSNEFDDYFKFELILLAIEIINKNIVIKD